MCRSATRRPAGSCAPACRPITRCTPGPGRWPGGGRRDIGRWTRATTRRVAVSADEDAAVESLRTLLAEIDAGRVDADPAQRAYLAGVVDGLTRGPDELLREVREDTGE